MPRIRACPEDFFVDEIPESSLEGTGPHTYIQIEKRLATTDEVLRELARAAKVETKEVGYAGRKDKFAVTRQWFSVPNLDPEKAEKLELSKGRILAVDRHLDKLRTGHLRGNRFALTVREVTQAESRRARDLLDQIREKGLPNRYGPQRFGHNGGNVEKGISILRADRLRIERRTAWLLVSAVQAAVFNEVLARRPFPLDQVIPGDVAFEHVTGMVYTVDDLERDRPRAASFEISPTGPIFGTKMKRPSGAVATLEQAAMAAVGLGDIQRLSPPRGIRLYGTRRPLRIRLEEVGFAWRDGALELRFALPAGSYATTVIEEVFPGGFEQGPA